MMPPYSRLDPELAALRHLADGMAEPAAEEHQRIFARVEDPLEPRLDQHPPAADLLGQRIAGTQTKGAVGAGRHRGLHHQLGAAELVPGAGERGLAEACKGQGRDGGDALFAELGEIGLVAVPAQHFDGIGDAGLRLFEPVEQHQPFGIILVIAPGDQRQDEVVAAEIAKLGPGDRVDLVPARPASGAASGSNAHRHSAAYSCGGTRNAMRKSSGPGGFGPGSRSGRASRR